VKTRLKISRNDDGDDNDYYGKDDKYYYGKDGKDDKYYYGKDGDSDSDDEITEQPQRGGSTHGMNIVSMCGDSDNRYGFVTKIIHMAAFKPRNYKMQYIAHRGYSQNIKTIV
jgi:hypothetical protein